MDDLLFALLPFLILIAFWGLLVRWSKRKQAEGDPVLEELKGIREELVRLRKALEQRGIG